MTWKFLSRWLLKRRLRKLDQEQRVIEARMAILDYIEGWYNPHRRHSSLDYE